MNDTSELFSYSGDELESFETAVNWKAYWSAQIAPYIGQDVLELGAGLGATARTLAGHPVRRWLGLEPDPAMCDVVRQRTRTMPFRAASNRSASKGSSRLPSVIGRPVVPCPTIPSTS